MFLFGCSVCGDAAIFSHMTAWHWAAPDVGRLRLHTNAGRSSCDLHRGRPRTTWLNDLATQANISYKEAITIPRDRKKWRSVGNPRRTPDEEEEEDHTIHWSCDSVVIVSCMHVITNCVTCLPIYVVYGLRVCNKDLLLLLLLTVLVVLISRISR